MTKIKDISIIILIAFIIASILYGIHMFRYEFMLTDDNIIRYDRITNTQCISAKKIDSANFKKYWNHLPESKTSIRTCEEER